MTVLLGIDATSVAPDGKGISRVQRGTVRALAALGRHELVVVARHPEELPEVEALRVSPRLTLEWEQRGLARAAREVDVMLTWTERLPIAGRARFVVWLFEPPTHRIEANRASGAGAKQRGSDLVTGALWRRSLRRAALVLAGSNATAAAIREVAPARTLYPGLDDRFAPGIDEPGDYVLHLGSGDPRDDTATAIAAAREAELPLVLAGGYAGPAEGADLMGRVSDEQLVELYRGAAVFLDTSLYEGFGYQVLEAMACGAPVVASDTTSIPELVGDAGLLCPPRNVSAFAAALRRAIDERGELRRRGLARARAFAWERTARELADAVDQVAA